VGAAAAGWPRSSSRSRTVAHADAYGVELPVAFTVSTEEETTVDDIALTATCPRTSDTRPRRRAQPRHVADFVHAISVA
jgi:hypothetical protein